MSTRVAKKFAHFLPFPRTNNEQIEATRRKSETTQDAVNMFDLCESGKPGQQAATLCKHGKFGFCRLLTGGL